MIKNILFIVVVLILYLAFFYGGKGPENTFPTFDTPSPKEMTAPAFECAGKKECWEMLSCDEAKFYLRKCRTKGLDPDGDGIPCEDICVGD